MGKNRQKLQDLMKVEKGKKILKKTRTGMWVVASMVGVTLVGVGISNMGGEDTEGIEVPAEQVVEVDSSKKKLQPNEAPVAETTEEDSTEEEIEEDNDVSTDLAWQGVLQQEGISGRLANEAFPMVNPTPIINANGNEYLNHKSVGDKLTVNKPVMNKPGVNKPGGNKPGVHNPEGNKPEANNPEGNKPEANNPEGNKPGVNNPEGNKPEVDKPEGNKPEVDKPEGNKPEGDKPEGNKPEVDKPEVEDSETDGDVEDGDKEDDVTPVDPDKEPEVEETPQVPETPEEPEVDGDEDDDVTPVDPDKEPEVEETPQEPETPEVPEVEGEDVEEDKEPEITTSTRTEREQIGYNIIRRENAELPLGEERVVQEGQYGILEKLIKITYKDGVLELEELLSTNVLMNPIDKIIEYGTFIERLPEITTSERKETSQIGYNKVRRENPEMFIGEEKVVQEGKFGTLVKTYKVTYEDGVEVNAELISEVVTEEAVDTIIEFGTKELEVEEPEIEEPEIEEPEIEEPEIEVPEVEEPEIEEPEVDEQEDVITTGTRIVKETIDFEIVYRDNDQLEEGKENVLQKGVVGEREVFYEQTFVNGVLQNEVIVSDNVTREPQVMIIERGTLKVTTAEREETEVIAFEEVRVANPNMLEGEERVVTEGVNGTLNKVYKQTFHNGVLVSEELVSEKVATNPVNKVIEYGTIKVTKGESVLTEILDYEVIYIKNPDLETGKEVIKQEGKPGKIESIYEVTYHNGVEVDRTLVDTKSTDPVNEIIEVGVAKVTTEEVVEEVEIDFDVIETENPDMMVGERDIISEGYKGKEVITYKVTYEDGVEVSREEISRQVTEVPQDQVVEVGTKEVKKVTETEELDYKVTYRVNRDLDEGEERVVQEGVKGEREVTYELTYVKGELVGKKELTSNVTKDPVEKIVDVGVSKDKLENEVYRAHFVNAPDKIYVHSDELEVGKMNEVQEWIIGQKFYDKDGNVIFEIEAQEGIVLVGTRGRVDKVLSMSDEEKYQLTKQITDGTELDYELLGERVGLLPYYNMTPEEIAQLYSSVDYNKLNEEFAKLINEHRASLGLKSLEYRSEYREGSEYIAKELADYGYIVPEGQRPHTLPGTEESNLAVFKKELGHTHIGENLTYHYNRNNPYTIVSEKYLAEKMFDNWMNSEGHRELMEKDYYTGFSFAVYPSMYGNTMIADEAPNGWLENYEKAPEHLGLGIMGQLVLMTHP